MATLTVTYNAADPVDAACNAVAHLNATSAGRFLTHYRIAQHVLDLPFADWRSASADAIDIPIRLPGYQVPSLATVAVECRYSTAETEIVTAQVGRGVVAEPPPPPPQENFLVRANCEFSCPWWLQQYNDTAPAAGNNFVPLDWSPGFAWSTERTRAIDVGETPDDIIVAHIYARWVNPALNVWDFSANTTRYCMRLAGENLDLKGGAAYFAVVCVHPNGRRGRYHLYGASDSPRALAIGTPAEFAETYRNFPSGSSTDWRCSWASDGVGIPNIPSGPSFAIEAIEIILRDFSAPPTGKLMIREFGIPQ
jgi:hypothetical protein